jgi:alkylation response protein AidB-like acyl-CoA dehydrogenase
MEFTETGHERELRAAVAAIAGKFGGEYYARKATAGEPTDELWQALGDAGFIGVNIGAEYGGGGAGLAELAMVCEAAAEQGCPPLPVAAQLPEKQFTLFFDGVRVGADRLLGAEGERFAQVFHGLNPERITGAALCVGIGRYVLERAAEYARTRSVWGIPIGAHQGIAHPLAKAKIAVETAALVTAHAAWLHDHGQPAGEAANMAKYTAAEAALAAVDAAIQTHGGNGMSVEYGLVPYWGLARLLRIAPVSAEMILNHVAQHSLRLPKSYGQPLPEEVQA